jgi:hypothetical protein
MGIGAAKQRRLVNSPMQIEQSPSFFSGDVLI